MIGPNTLLRVFIGFDPRPPEAQCFAVARGSLKRHSSLPIPIKGLILSELQKEGLYTRPTEVRDGRLFDVISGKPMSTEFAISRFLVPHLCTSGAALFMDADMLVRRNIMELFRQLDPTKAVMVVKHDHRPTADTKMDNQVQLSYERKNWSSVVLWNIDHPANKRLTLEMVNTMPGLWLHQFRWLKDEEIGELNVGWNWLAGISDPSVSPSIVHFTEGSPAMPGYEKSPYADEWWRELRSWAA